MSYENKTNSSTNANASKGKKRKYLPHGRPVKKGQYPLHPGVEGFFLTCDGGRERQATNEAINILDSFYEELVEGKNSNAKPRDSFAKKPMNKKITFKDSDSDSDSDSSDEKTQTKEECKDEASEQLQAAEESAKNEEKEEENHEDLQSKKQRTDNNKSIDELINDELKELGDRKKRKFISLDSGCNGCLFIQMQRGDGDPSPADIVQHIMSSLSTTRKHMSRFILRLMPAEISCYASEEEITKAIKPLVERYFPEGSSTPKKFAVLYEVRANTGIDKMKIINAVAKSVPQPHKVDLSNPDKTIIVQIAKTVCLVGVVKRYKELCKFNLRQLTNPQQ